MPNKIWRLNAPIIQPGDIPPIEYLNIFRNDMETYRPSPHDPMFSAYWKRYYAACRANGNEIMIIPSAGSDYVALGAYDPPVARNMINLSAEEKAVHAAMMELAYQKDAAAGLIPPGEVVDADEV